MVEYNTVIIGSGIAGMSCAIYLKRAGIKTLIIEGNVVGGQLNKSSVIENYPGYDKINGSDLAMNLYNQVNSYETDYLYEEVIDVDLKRKIVMTRNSKVKYHYLVIATGRRNRLLGLDNEDKLIGSGISFCASCDGNLYKNKSVVVIGGANSAISEALYLSGICKKVYLIYRRDELRGENILCDRLEDKDNIEVIYHSNVREYLEDGGILIGVKLDDGKVIDCSCVFVAIGFVPNGELFDVDKDVGYIVVDDHYMTSVNGVYACGDIIKKSVYQLGTAVGEAVNVASEIIRDNVMKK